METQEMTFSSNVLSIECNGPVGTLWLDRPEKRNAMSQEMWTSLPAAISELGNNPDIRAVIIAGRGKSFCAGLDISSLGEAMDQSRCHQNCRGTYKDGHWGPPLGQHERGCSVQNIQRIEGGLLRHHRVY